MCVHVCVCACVRACECGCGFSFVTPSASERGLCQGTCYKTSCSKDIEIGLIPLGALISNLKDKISTKTGPGFLCSPLFQCGKLFRVPALTCVMLLYNMPPKKKPQSVSLHEPARFLLDLSLCRVPNLGYG